MKPALVLVLGLIIGLIALGLATLNQGILLLSIPLMAYLAAAIFQRPEGIDLLVTREVHPDNAPEGTPITVKVTLTNQGQVIDELMIRDVLPGGVSQINGKSRAVAFLASGANVVLDYMAEATRGAYDHFEAQVYARDTFGLFEWPLLYRTTSHLLVQPRYPTLDRIKIRPPQTRGFAGPIAARQGGSGIGFWGIREYQPGDSQRHINRRLSARMDQGLYTNVFEQERVADVGLILDARERTNVMTAAGSLFEHAIRATAALAENFLNDGNRVSLLVYGYEMGRVFPGYGRVQRHNILKQLAQAKPGKNYALESLDYLPTRFFPAKSQIVLISGLVPEDVPVIVKMRAQGYTVLLISPDPVAFEAAVFADSSSPGYRMAAAERDFLLRQVRHSGVQVVNWNVAQPLAGVIRGALARQPLIHHLNRIGP